MRNEQVLGVDACTTGWVDIALGSTMSTTRPHAPGQHARVARGEARSRPDRPEVFSDGLQCAIWS